MGNTYSTEDLMDADFEPMVDRTLNLEGGITTDTGGLTNKGVTQTLFNSYNRQRNRTTKSVRDITTDEAKEVYYEEFYKRPKINQLPSGLKDIIFDYGVQSSPKRAVEALQSVVGSQSDGKIGPNTLKAVDTYIKKNGQKELMKNVMDKREEFIKTTPAYKKTPEGLMNRLNKIRSEFDLSMFNLGATDAYADTMDTQDTFTTEELMGASAAKPNERPSKAAIGTTFTTDQLMAEEDFSQDLSITDTILTHPIFEALTKTRGGRRGETGKEAEPVFENIKQSFKEGAISDEISQANYAFLNGKITPEQAKALNEARKEIPRSKDNNFITNTLNDVANMLPAMMSGIEEGVRTGAVAGGAALAGGTTAPVAPAMFAAGNLVGSASYWYRQGSGDLYYDMYQQGIPDDIAKPTAHIGGTIYAAIEFAQIDKFIPGGKNLVKRAVGDTTRKVISKIIAKLGINTVVNSSEEFLQTAVTETAPLIAKQLAGEDVNVEKAISDVLTKSVSSFTQSLAPMALLGIPGASVNVAQAISEGEKNVRAQGINLAAAKAVEELKNEMDIEGQQPDLARDAEGNPLEINPVDENDAYQKKLEEMSPFNRKYPEYDIPLHPAEEGRAMAEALERTNEGRQYTAEEHQALQDIKPLMTGKGDAMLVARTKPEFLKGLNVTSAMAQDIFGRAINGEVLTPKEQKLVDGLTDKMVTFNKNTMNEAVKAEDDLDQLRNTFPDITDEEIEEQRQEVADEWEDEKLPAAIKSYLAKTAGNQEGQTSGQGQKLAEEVKTQPTDLDTQAQQAVAEGKSLEEFLSSKKSIHRPPDLENGSSLDDLTPSYGEDIYSKEALQYYGEIDNKADQKAIRKIKLAKGKPEVEITVFRAIEKGEDKSFKAGDWVSITKEYAVEHGEGVLDGNYEIIEKTVKAKDLIGNADSLQEYGYRPEGHKDLTTQQLTSAYEKAKAESTTTENKTIPLELQQPEKKELFQEKGELFADKITDPSKVQEIQNSILEGEMILKDGGINGRKMSKQELDAVKRSVEKSKNKISEPKINIKELLSDLNDAFGNTGSVGDVNVTAKQKEARRRLIDKHLPALMAEASRVGKTFQAYLEDLGQFSAEQINDLVNAAREYLLTAQQVTVLDKESINKAVEKENKYQGIILQKPPTPTDAKEQRMGKFQLPPETLGEAARRKIEDINIRLKKLNEAIINIAGEIKDEEDIYMQKDMLPRVTNDAISKIRDDKHKLVEDTVKDGVSIEGIDIYMHALHAKERNAKMNEVGMEQGRAPVDGLSGMTNAEADKILKDADPKFAKYVPRLRKMMNETLNYQVREGLLKAEHADIISKTYKNYVPLYRDIEGDLGSGIGQGLNIQGKEIKRAKGSEKRVTSPIANMFYQRERTVTRKLKNDIGKNIVQLTEQHPELKDLFKVEKQTFMPVYNEDGELIFMDPKFVMGNNVIGAKMNGDQYFITIKDDKIARALKNTGVVQTGALTNTLRAGIGLWSGFKTRWNPEFLLTNFERDLGEALVNIGIEKTALGREKGKHLRKDILKGLFPAQRAIIRHIRGKEINAEFARFLELGGDTGHFYVENNVQAEKSLRQLEKEIKGEGLNKLLNPLRAAGQVIADLNTMVELGVRFSTYQQLTKRGMSEKRASQSAADLTVNFSRQGELSPYLKAAYGFINPAIQGSSKVIRSIATRDGQLRYSRRMAKSIVGLAVLGFITRAISSMIDDEGDEQIPQWSKNNKMVVADGRGGNIILWNLPYGYSSFYALGSNAYELMRGRINLREALSNQFESTVDSFSPFGTSLNSFYPTLVKPIIEVNNNKNWYNGPIKPSAPFDNTPAPNSEMYFDRVDKNALMITTMLNKLSGGGKGRAGLIDVSPNDLQYLFHQYVGGPVEFTMSSIDAVARGAKGQFDPGKTPFVRKFYREGSPQQWSNSIIYDTLDRAGKKDISKMEKDRFFRAIDTGVKSGLVAQDRANKNVQDFLRATYNLEGAITSVENSRKIRTMPQEDKMRILNSYSANTRTAILKGGSH